MTVALILAGALLTISSCWSAGRLVFRWVGLPSAFTGAIQFGTGAAVVSGLIFMMCALHLVSTSTLVFLGLGLVAASFAAIRPVWAMPRLSLWWIPFAVFGAWYFINALAPETSADGTFYHLAFPMRYLEHGGFYRVTTNFYANLSQGVEMLFLMAFAVGKHSAGALTHLSFLFALAAGLVAYASSIGKPSAGWLAALIVFTSPVIGFDATLAYNDVAVAAVLFLLFATLMRWDTDRARGWLIVAGLLAGFGYAIKYTAFLATPYAIGFVLWRSRSWKSALPLATCALVLMAPWMIKNWLWLDNPVSPFFNRVFPNAYVSIAFEDEYRNNLRHFNGAELGWRTLVDVTLTGNKVGGNLGPLFLLTPLAVAGIKTMEVRRLLFAGILFLLPWFGNIGTRFLIPCAPFFALAIALSLARWQWAVPVFAVLQTVSVWPSVVGLYCEPYNWRLTEWPVTAALREIPEEDFIASRIDTYPIVRMIDRNTPPGSVIYTALPLPEAYSERTYLLNYAGALNQSIQEMRWTPFYTDSQPTVRLTFRIPDPPTNIEKLRIVQKGGCGGRWSVSEIRWTPDRPAKLTGHPNPWNIPWSHDGNPATRWKVWEDAKPGMYLEAAFDQSAPVESVEIDASPDQSNTCIELRTQSGGVWRTLAKPPEIQAIPLPADIRRDVIEAIRGQGVTHLLIHKDERAADDFETRQADWGIAKVGESGPGRLYRIEVPPKNIHQR
jgi:hypothetical protein